MTRPPRRVLAAVLAVAITLVANAADCAWLRGSDFASGAFYDGSALFLTLAIPSFLGGLALGRLAPDAALPTTLLAFVPFCLLSLVRPFWQIPPVTARSAHSGLLHYFLYNPLTALAFAALGAWLSSQFAQGRWTLTDAHPVAPPDAED